MTAIVGILNKTGAVIAADSATTVPRDQGNRMMNPELIVTPDL